MRFLPLRKDKNECFLALDIGTEAVKALVFEKSFDAAQDGKKYCILSAALRYFDELRPFEDDKVILNTAEEALGRVGRRPKELLISLPPNILRSRVGTFEFKRREPEITISSRKAKAIIDFSIQEAQKEIAKGFAESSGILPKDLQFIDNEVLGIKIDGYEVPILSGYSGKKIELSILASFLPIDYIEKFSKISRRLSLNYRIVNPARSLGTLCSGDAIFVDIGGDITQVFLFKNGKLEAADEFEIGGRGFSRLISQTLGMSFGEARFFKERYSEGGLTEDSRERVKDILTPYLEEWHSLLKAKLEAMKPVLPSTFFLFGGGSQLLGIEEQFAEKEIKFIYPKDLKNIIDNTHCVNNPQFINSTLLFYHV